MRTLFDAGPDALELFLTAWYGEPDREPEVSASGIGPPPLRGFFEVTSRWSRPLTTHNHVLTPERVRAEDGRRVFCVENQSVWVWGMEEAGEDPAVYDRLNEAGEEWLPTGVPLSTFLLHLAVFEAIMGAPEPAIACSAGRAERDAALEPLRALPMPAWRWPGPGQRLYAGEGLLAFTRPTTGPDDGAASEHEVWIAAREPDRLHYLTALPASTWDVFPDLSGPPGRGAGGSV
ncbi:hypothetical protein GCM10027176_57910 [Actinoallomurus bryophytorum]|uniref:Uncharacterized protein n=1 Tax=Actinoallomurus bryophytorum TaxID=1490222 RepID=A0A543CCW2_9ACTN|nr:hypothetical protein [Actinoallomurus bryophytorum]TQL94928.1 hypothetical protein FB559_0416 [Actinoallomurus bryophytorum]